MDCSLFLWTYFKTLRFNVYVLLSFLFENRIPSGIQINKNKNLPVIRPNIVIAAAKTNSDILNIDFINFHINISEIFF